MPIDRRPRSTTQPVIARRDLLRFAGGIALLLPALEACGRAGGSAPERIGRKGDRLGTAPTRLITNFTPFGIVPESYWPTGSETSFQLPEILQPFERHKDNLIVLKGVENVAAGYGQVLVPNGDSHTPPTITLFTGVPGIDHEDYSISHEGTSIDQVIGDQFEKSGGLFKKKSLQLGMPYDTPSASYPASGAPFVAQSDPATVFRMLFDDPQATEAELAKLRARRKSILDDSSSSYDKLASKVSGDDRKRIQAHMDAIRDVEKRIFVGSTASCSPSSLNLPGSYPDGELRKTMFDLGVLALSCDATRIVNFFHFWEDFTWLGVPGQLHDYSHNIVGTSPGSDSRQKMTKVLTWFNSTTSDFVDKLKAVVLPDGTSLFDSTVLVGASEISYDHAWTDIPFYLLAGKNTTFRTGRFVTLPGQVPHNHLLVTLLNAFGVNMTSFGDPRWASGNVNAQLLA